TAATAAAMHAQCIDLATPGFTFGAMAALLKNSRLVITNDTGTSHLAAALKTPSVVIFTASDPQRSAPLDTTLHYAVHAPVDCRRCSHYECPIGHACSHELSPSVVVAKVLQLLSMTEGAFPAHAGRTKTECVECAY